MIYFLYILFFLLCFIIAIKIINQFSGGFDWFSGTLYFIIFLVSCGLLYITIFGLYHAVK